MQYYLEIITYDPSLCRMDHPDCIVCSFMENSIGLKRVKCECLALQTSSLIEKLGMTFKHLILMDSSI